MASVNKVILIGNLGKDPETKYTPSGVQVTKFSLATTDKQKKGDNWEEKTEWHNIVCFGKTAEIAHEFIKKGHSIYLEGKISTRTYEDQTGQKKYWTEILANHITMLTRRESSGEGNYQGGGNNYQQNKPQQQQQQQQQSQPQSAQTNNAPAANQSEDDLPF